MNRYLVFDIETGVINKNGPQPGLSPLSSCVSCICCKVVGDGAPICFSGVDECKILHDFVSFVHKNNITHIVTYNGWAFDVPFLRVRAMVCGIKLPSMFWDDAKVLDPFHILARNKTGKQCEFAYLFGKQTIGTGLDCLTHFEKMEFDKIEEHCTSDIIALEVIFHKMLGSGLAEVL